MDDVFDIHSLACDYDIVLPYFIFMLSTCYFLTLLIHARRHIVCNFSVLSELDSLCKDNELVAICFRSTCVKEKT